MSDEPAAYDVDFEWDESHGRLVTLLSLRPQRGIVIDLGCGYAPHAEPLRDAGFTYVGLDINDAALDALRKRGFDARLLDLGDRERTFATLNAVALDAEAPVAAVLALDVVEHLAEPHLLLGELSHWLRRHDGAVIGLSVPNVGHRDIAVKLLAGRWDVTPTGLLDQTHLRFFTDRSLEALMESASFCEVERADRPAARSDQYRPRASPFIAPGARLGAWLRSLRARVDEHDATYQFIRLYEPTEAASRPSLIEAVMPSPRAFLSVVADPAMTDEEVGRLRQMLDAQSSPGWELLHASEVDFDVPRHEVISSLLAEANGLYVSIVGPTDVINSKWVGQFFEAAYDAGGQLTGQVLKCAAGPGPELGLPHPAVAELGPLDSSSATFAVPLDAIRQLGLDVAGSSLPPTVELVLGAVQFCGVAWTGAVAVDLWARVEVDEMLVTERLAAVDAQPVLMAPGILARLGAIEDARLAAERRVEELTTEVDRLRADNDWLNKELGVTPVRAVRKALRRPPSQR
jgi:hypothetical protein